MSNILEKLREVTRGTKYEGKLYLVGGIVRDKVLGLPDDEDIDIVLEGEATSLAQFIFDSGIADHKPVVYPRFGTAMVSIDGQQVELVSARAESYTPESRKPDVVPATLSDDVLRRDFTINTLLENLHTGEVLDLTGRGMKDIRLGLIRTPTDPLVTFEDDPLRMLRAIRFASRFGFKIDEMTYRSLREKAHRLSIISKERIRDEFSKMLMTHRRADAIEMLRSSGLLSEFAPELETMYGVTQNIYHLYDVWTHTLKALEALPEDSDITLRLAALFHDIGKPATRSVDDEGNVHFYTHQNVGASITYQVLTRLRYPNDVIDRVVKIVAMHLRVGEYDSEWSDAAIRRLIRDAGTDLDALITLTKADKSAANLAMPSADLDELQRRIDEVNTQVDIASIQSPLNGNELMEMLQIPPGPLLREIKDFLVNEIIEGRLVPDDKDQARELIMKRWDKQKN
jgi:poly(A) polymerase